MILFTYKPEWNQAFTGATHLIQLVDTSNYVFAVHHYGDFFSSTNRITSFNNFDVIESRPVESDGEFTAAQETAFNATYAEILKARKSYKEALESSTLKIGSAYMKPPTPPVKVELNLDSAHDKFMKTQKKLHANLIKKVRACITNDTAKIEANGIRKAVAHLKENHGGDRFYSTAYLVYADNLENNHG